MLRKKGFTLIELLVVIAIIAVLMGILMPALQRVKKQGYAVVCRNNFKSIGLAAQMYADDNRYLVPRGLIQADDEAWFQLFMPYLAQKPTTAGDYRTVDIYRCKSYPNKQQTVCYVINGWGFTSETDMTGHEEQSPTKIINLKRAYETIYLTDNEYIENVTPIITEAYQDGIETCDVRKIDDLAYNFDGEINGNRRVPLDRHSRGSNILYMDGSVGHLEADEITIEKFRTHN